MTDFPLLSVVMPTHNRGQYARHAIRSILDIVDRGLQLVVHDTSTGTDLADFVTSQVRDDRLIYVHHESPLSMTENHNAAMALATGRYVCLIGDDDTILPEALDAVRLAEWRGIEALTPTIVANYAWPDFVSRIFGKKHARRLYIRRKSGFIRICDSREAVAKALSLAAQGTTDLPKLYHGFVRRDVLLRIRDKAGAYFCGSSPDVAAAIAVGLMTSSYVEVDYPLTLPGASGQSNTGRSAMNRHESSLDTEPQTAVFAETGWPTDIPRFFSVETVWAHSALRTVEALCPEKRTDYDLARLAALCWLKHSAYRHETGAVVRLLRERSGKSGGQFAFAFLLKMLDSLRREGSRLAWRATVPTPAGRRRHIGGLDNIAAAQAAMIGDLAAHGESFAAFWARFEGDRLLSTDQ